MNCLSHHVRRTLEGVCPLCRKEDEETRERHEYRVTAVPPPPLAGGENAEFVSRRRRPVPRPDQRELVLNWHTGEWREEPEYDLPY